MRLTTLAPAKVNLVLRVGPLRADGFHDIDSLMVPLDLGDEVEVRVGARAGPVTCRVPRHPGLDGPGNLAARAAEAFRARFGIDRSVAIRIVKRTPITAGLGGGSSDAAAVIRCLARAFRIRDSAALEEIGLVVGSDVPFFLGDGPAWAAGRGERLAPAKVATLHLVLAYPTDPALAIRAGDAYRWLDAARGEPARARIPRRAPRFSPRAAANDLEAPCLARFAALSTLRGRVLSLGASVAMMSGSGPTVFGIFADRRAATRAAAALQEEGKGAVRVFAVRTTQRHPRVVSWRSPRSASSPSTRRS
ncbi:MAG TPA: 4-(cytidine 5'-diphospho)-2-C-methyl-D-erythritol kinase [Anaeromyxobacteraceae bacterium]|nr:4-(cytidine 5'-diphospho)-2-C-methyl-D-erythritol kinase [Anaeromyxobacteraceae bacterium]